MNYWWVNHKQTVRQEIDGGYLWSPKKMSNGGRSQYYEFMRLVRPGDRVVSYANTLIKYYGTAIGFPISAPKPDEFGGAGENWSNDGWLIPVQWENVQNPVKPKEYMGTIEGLLPHKYAPIQNNGNGNQAAYLTQIEQALFDHIMQLGNTEVIEGNNLEWENEEEIIEKIEDEIEDSLRGAPNLDATETDAVIKARRGQGKFRKNVEAIEACCRVTGLRDKRLLIASHIKPWRSCHTPEERLDGANGLLLSPHIDRLFDKGLISFEKAGQILISDTLDDYTISCLGLEKAKSAGVGDYSDEQETYLAYHRDNVFLK